MAPPYNQTPGLYKTFSASVTCESRIKEITQTARNGALFELLPVMRADRFIAYCSIDFPHTRQESCILIGAQRGYGQRLARMRRLHQVDGPLRAGAAA